MILSMPVKPFGLMELEAATPVVIQFLGFPDVD
jgi:hypothetical protein